MVDPTPAAVSAPLPRMPRVAAAAALASGVVCLLAALAAAGGVAAILLDAITSGAGDNGGCMGACVLPALTLAGAAALGTTGAGLCATGGLMFWRMTAVIGETA